MKLTVVRDSDETPIGEFIPKVGMFTCHGIVRDFDRNSVWIATLDDRHGNVREVEVTGKCAIFYTDAYASGFRSRDVFHEEEIDCAIERLFLYGESLARIDPSTRLVAWYVEQYKKTFLPFNRGYVMGLRHHRDRLDTLDALYDLIHASQPCSD